MSLGYSQTDTWLAGYAPVLGVYGISALLLVGAGALVTLAWGSRGERLWAAAALAAIWMLGLPLSRIVWTHPSGPPVSVAIALLLTAVGIYGVISYGVAQRTHEIGIRLALGATRMGVLRLIVGEAMRPTLLGATAGLGIALGVTRLLTRLLFHVRATDPPTYAVVLLILAAVLCAGSPRHPRRSHDRPAL
jgi:hypothetical protein